MGLVSHPGEPADRPGVAPMDLDLAICRPGSLLEGRCGFLVECFAKSGN
jgi:hypothetical protein